MGVKIDGKNNSYSIKKQMKEGGRKKKQGQLKSKHRRFLRIGTKLKYSIVTTVQQEWLIWTIPVLLHCFYES